MSEDKLDEQLLGVLHSNNVHVKDFSLACNSVVDLEESMKCVLEYIFSTTSSVSHEKEHIPGTTVLVIGSPQSFFDCLVIACLRRVQDWSVVSILSEFRTMQGPLQKRSPYAEQFIEYFDKNVVDMTRLPEFLSVHQTLLKEEESLLAKLKLTSSGEEEETLKMLFFSPPNVVITPQARFTDLSVVDDKDVDD